VRSAALTQAVNLPAQQQVDSTDDFIGKLFFRMADRVRRVALAGQEREYVPLEQMTTACAKQLSTVRAA
jgi:hypothetical protein